MRANIISLFIFFMTFLYRTNCEDEKIYIEHVEEPIIECPKHYEYFEKEKLCKKTETKPVNVVCEHPSKLVDGYCVHKENSHSELSCPEGFHRHGSKKCVAVEKLKALYSCKHGENPDEHGVCITKSITKPIIKCPKGYKKCPDDHLCYKETKEKSDIICPIDTIPNKKGVCIQYEKVSSNLKCPKDYEITSDKKSCIKIKILPKNHKCPKGYHETKKGIKTNEIDCIKVIKIEGEHLCNKNYKYDGKKCVMNIYKKTII